MRISLIEAFLWGPVYCCLVYCFSDDEVTIVALLSCAFPVNTISPLCPWVLVLASFWMLWQTLDTKQCRERKGLFCLQFLVTVHHSRNSSSWSRDICSQEQGKNISKLTFFTHTQLKSPCLGNSATCNGLDLPITINNQDSSSQTCPVANLI